MQLSQKFSYKYGWESWLLHNSHSQELWTVGSEAVWGDGKCAILGSGDWVLYQLFYNWVILNTLLQPVRDSDSSLVKMELYYSFSRPGCRNYEKNNESTPRLPSMCKCVCGCMYVCVCVYPHTYTHIPKNPMHYSEMDAGLDIRTLGFSPGFFAM